MITPLDIQNKTFNKAMRGYKAEEVDMFLDMITLDLEKIIKENNRLKSENEEMSSELNKYKGSEGEVVKVLEQAKQLMDDISKSAEKRADVIIKNAELDADMILREAKDNAVTLKEQNATLKNKYENFRNRYEKMLQDELQHFRTLTDNMFPEFENDKLEEILAADDEPVQTEKKLQQKQDQEKPDISESEKSVSEIDEGGMSDKTIVMNGKEPEKKKTGSDDMKKTMIIDMDQQGGE